MSSITGEGHAAIITVEKQQGPSRRQAPGVEERTRRQTKCRRPGTSERSVARRTSERTFHVAQALRDETLRIRSFHIEALCIRSLELASLGIIARADRFHAAQRQLGQRSSFDDYAQREQQAPQCERQPPR